jgi:hypothetical protein
MPQSGSGNTLKPAALAPAAPPSPGGQAPLTVTPAMLSPQDMAALQVRGAELSRQLNSVTGRRQSLQGELRRATGADRAGLEQRLGVLDTRIARLEGDIDENGRQLASLPAARQSALGQAPPIGRVARMNRLADNAVPIMIVFTIFVLSPLAVSISRLFWRRASVPKYAAPSAESSQRLERMEQAIDSIAIEIERVSEGQRFVTRILSEPRSAGALGQAEGDRLNVPAAEKVGVPR